MSHRRANRTSEDRPRNSDALLVNRCRAGDSDAWRELYRHTQPVLVQVIRAMIGRPDENVVDEIAAQVWFQLVRNNGALLARFDVTRKCRLSTFLAAMARNQVKEYRRSEQRRRNRETAASIPEAALGEIETSLEVEELRSALSEREREYFEWCLEPVGQSEFDASANGTYQIRYRLRQKIRTAFS